MRTRVTQSAQIPPPVAGLNLVSAPHLLDPTEARELTNFLVTDAGIAEVGNVVLDGTVTGAQAVFRLTPYLNPSAVWQYVFFSNNRVWRASTMAVSSWTDITGAAVITTSNWTSIEYAQQLFFCSGVNPMIRYDRSAATVATVGFVGPSGADSLLIGGTTYKNRIYLVEGGASTRYWYSGIAAITGALTSVDLAAVFQTPGELFAVSNWTVNQGLSNEEVFVAVNRTGEVLVYAGDFPGATNWALIGRARVPEIRSSQPFVRIGTDLYLNTTRGVIGMSQLFAGRGLEQGYSATSAKIKNQINPFIVPRADTVTPYLFAVNSGSTGLYALNYERGAWSAVLPRNSAVAAGSLTVNDFCVANGIVIIGTNNGQIYRIPLFTGGLPATEISIWRSGFSDLGAAGIKSVKWAKIQARNLLGTDFTLTAGCEQEFQEPTYPPTVLLDTASAPALTGPLNIPTQEITLQISANGDRIAPIVYQAGTSRVREIQGMEIYFEAGGFE